MKVLMQSSCLPLDQQERTVRALHDLGVPVEDFGMIPFTDELVGVAQRYPYPVVLLGSAKMVKVARQHYPELTPGVFFDEQTFLVETWCRELGAIMLNHDTETTSFGALLAPFEGYRFIRPLGDLKQFNGTTLNHAEYVEWFGNNRNPELGVTEEGPVASAAAKNIVAEWRCFMVEGRAVSGSQYRRNGQLAVVADFPDKVAEFAENIAARWAPAPIFVMDVALLRDGQYRVIEFNCFNASGWYEADREAVLAAVDHYVDTHFGPCSACDGSGWAGCRSLNIVDPANDPGMRRCGCVAN